MITKDDALKYATENSICILGDIYEFLSGKNGDEDGPGPSELTALTMILVENIIVRLVKLTVPCFEEELQISEYAHVKKMLAVVCNDVENYYKE